MPMSTAMNVCRQKSSILHTSPACQNKPGPNSTSDVHRLECLKCCSPWLLSSMLDQVWSIHNPKQSHCIHCIRFQIRLLILHQLFSRGTSAIPSGFLFVWIPCKYLNNTVWPCVCLVYWAIEYLQCRRGSSRIAFAWRRKRLCQSSGASTKLIAGRFPYTFHKISQT